jgi:uncharacterized membrane protein
VKLLSEKNYHFLFEVGIIFKAIYSVIEVILGLLFVFFDYETLYRVAIFLTGDELSESRTNPIWGYALHTLREFVATPREFWAFLFISHGVVKIFLVWGLLRDKLWAYPLSAVIFVLFIISQLYQMRYTPSLALWAITIFDVVLVALILHEYRHKKKKLVLRI